ncbi:MAG: ATP-binding protein [Aquihabitans sp.]
MADRIQLAPTAASAGKARRWTAEHAARAGVGEVSDTLGLLVSELVSNVVLHAHTPCDLSISRLGTRLRVELRDGSPRLPKRVGQPDPFALSGRGMFLVDALSDAHGAEPLDGGGKMVWFELELPGSDEP